MERPGVRLRHQGHTTDFTEEVTTMKINRQPVEAARVGNSIGLRIGKRVRENDTVFKVEDEFRNQLPVF
jgi:hypothetical protein